MSILSANSRRVPTKPAWQESLRLAVRDLDELCRRLQLDPAAVTAGATELQRSLQAAAEFPLFAPREFVARMQIGDPCDPLLLQVLPTAAEVRNVVGFSTDPVGDRLAETQPGLLRKYAHRALLIVTGACAVHCRYCFRRHFPYAAAPKGLAAWQPALDQLAADGSIDEVILSGGDPLTMNDAWLGQLISRIEQIRHVKRLRIHTRLPVMIPQRITAAFTRLLGKSRLTPIVVLHVNHGHELRADDVHAAIDRLTSAGIPLLNQAVLLAGINDDVDTLERLCRDLIDLRVMPYYLHQLDRVSGAAHFEVAVAEGLAMMEQLQRRLPGYAVPRYVRETPGELCKSRITRA